MNDEKSNLIDMVQRYLRQQEELFGAAIVREGASNSIRRHPVEGGAGPAASSGGSDLFADKPVEQAAVPSEPWMKTATLEELHGQICGCMKCPLGRSRTKFVFGVGNPEAKAVLIGEAPGADEDAQGEPFVGRAGQLLNKILGAIHFQREEVFICNILKCRPPQNRDPLPSEVAECEPYLHKQLDLLRPRVILALGRIAAQTLLRTNDSLTKLRNVTHTYRGIPLIVTYHPAAILRNPNWKRPTWEDVQRFRALYDQLAQT